MIINAIIFKINIPAINGLLLMSNRCYFSLPISSATALAYFNKAPNLVNLLDLKDVSEFLLVIIMYKVDV